MLDGPWWHCTSYTRELGWIFIHTCDCEQGDKMHVTRDLPRIDFHAYLVQNRCVHGETTPRKQPLNYKMTQLLTLTLSSTSVTLFL